MEEGQFENLFGKGKFLNFYINFYVDLVEDILYWIFNKNGFVFEWVEFNKDI